MRPIVVSASKSGAVSPIRSDMWDLLQDTRRLACARWLRADCDLAFGRQPINPSRARPRAGRGGIGASRPAAMGGQDLALLSANPPFDRRGCLRGDPVSLRRWTTGSHRLERLSPAGRLPAASGRRRRARLGEHGPRRPPIGSKMPFRPRSGTMCCRIASAQLASALTRLAIALAPLPPTDRLLPIRLAPDRCPRACGKAEHRAACEWDAEPADGATAGDKLARTTARRAPALLIAKADPVRLVATGAPVPTGAMPRQRLIGTRLRIELPAKAAALAACTRALLMVGPKKWSGCDEPDLSGAFVWWCRDPPVAAVARHVSKTVHSRLGRPRSLPVGGHLAADCAGTWHRPTDHRLQQRPSLLGGR